MRFLREDKEKASQAIAKGICDGLFTGERVLWLVSGGSNIAIEKAVMDTVRAHADNRLSGLAILPVDERYGHPGHVDSNIQQLREAGLEPGAATVVDVLLRDLPLEQTVSFYNDAAATALANASVIVGQFGMGADGHIAGIKPDSPATEADESTVIGYTWSDYIRLTLTPSALRQVTIGFLLAYGADKKKKLAALQRNKSSLKTLPAELLYELPDVTIYNDQIESED